MKNYYELLEVSEKASQEVIKKAYITLVKKYHPDLQPDSEKKVAEERIKEINEAYEVLSDTAKREKYDRQLQMQRVKNTQSSNNTNTSNRSSVNSNYQTQASRPNKQSKPSTNNSQKRVIHTPRVRNTDDFNNVDMQEDYNNIIKEVYNNAYSNAYNDAYNQAYINNLRNMGYDIQYEKPLMERVKHAFATICGILIFLVICFILWHIPFIRNYLLGIYNDNSIIKAIVDILISIVKSFFGLFS